MHQASPQSHSHPHSSVGVHLDHWAVCSGSRGEGVCLPVRHRQCVSGERNNGRWLSSLTVYHTLRLKLLYDSPSCYVQLIQGAFIFLLHVVRHEKVWGKIKTKLPKLKVL